MTALEEPTCHSGCATSVCDPYATSARTFMLRSKLVFALSNRSGEAHGLTWWLRGGHEAARVHTANCRHGSRLAFRSSRAAAAKMASRISWSIQPVCSYRTPYG